jgi:hypothetical protein
MPVQMRRMISIAVVAAIVAGVTCTFVPMMWNTRSAGPVSSPATLQLPAFERAQAMGLFAGVSDFGHAMIPVPYAVDDAVDLAYMFAMDRRVALVPPQHVVLALSGAPRKTESKTRLTELLAAGARRTGATKSEIDSELRKQAAAAGSHGILVFSIASHGFMDHGTEYILGRSSIYRDTQSSLSAARLLDIIEQSPARRTLVFIDACRDRVLDGVRGEAAPAIARKMKNISGQAVFYAAGPGNYAYDDRIAKNGVFTKAVLDGLACNAPSPAEYVTVDSLHGFVERGVKEWLEKNRKPPVKAAIQVNLGGNTKSMPLSRCWSPPGPERLSTSFDGTRLTVFNQEKQRIWEESFSSPIVHADVADVDADGWQEIVVAFPNTLAVYDRKKTLKWQERVQGIRTFAIGDLWHKHSDQIVALTDDTVTVFQRDGKRLGTNDRFKGLRHIVIDRETTRHRRKIIVATEKTLAALSATRITSVAWQLDASGTTIRDLKVIQRDKDVDKNDIVVTTANGTSVFDFDGAPLKQGAKWQKPPRKRKKAMKPAGGLHGDQHAGSRSR